MGSSQHYASSILFALSILYSLAIYEASANADGLPVNWPGTLPSPGSSSVNPAAIIPRPVDAVLAVPSGFSVEAYVRDLPGPRFMILSPQGDVLVALMDSGRVVRIDADREVTDVVTGLRGPFGMAWLDGDLLIADVDAVRRFDYQAKGSSPANAGTLLVDISAYASGHTTRSLLADAEGQGFYLSIGSGSNVAAGEPPQRAAISHYAADGSGQRLVASGIRNGVGLRLHPATQELWATSQERDLLGDELVSDYLTDVHDGDFFGWPYAYTGPHEDPRHQGSAPDRVATTRYPQVLLGAHVGALDFTFYTGTQFPEPYRSGAFVALHGSWNHSRRVGYQVAFVPFTNGRASAGPEPFLHGFSLGERRREVWGRPVGVIVASDGSLLVSDDAGDCIWRVRYTGAANESP